MIAASGRRADQALATHAPTGRVCTVHAAAVNAVMAGCLPKYFPIVVAALEAADRDRYTFHGSTASTGGSTPMLIVSGPIAEQIGMNAAANVFGPGNRANATIGRAMRLIILNVFQMIPGVSDRSTQGWPGKYGCCIAENTAASPWSPLHDELGFRGGSSVTVFAASGFHNIENHYTDDPEALLSTFADAMASLGAFSDGESVIVMSPEHAKIATSRGWSKQDIQEFLFAQAWREQGELRRAGKVPHDAEPWDDEARVHRGLGPDDILIVVAGADAGGHSAFLTSWSRARGSLRQSRRIES